MDMQSQWKHVDEAQLDNISLQPALTELHQNTSIQTKKRALGYIWLLPSAATPDVDKHIDWTECEE